MSTSSPAKQQSMPRVGGLTALVLGFVTVLCILLIGACGYIKLRLDHAEAVLSAPQSTQFSENGITDKLRRTLGYGGVLGNAQNFLITHEPSILSDMRQNMKQANDLIAQLPEKTPAETRREIQAIATTFENMVQQAEKSVGNDVLPFMVSDLLPLYAAIPVLEARLDAAASSARLDARTEVQYWSMLLTIVCWASLILAAIMSAGIYLTILNRQSAPLRALSQSIRNMASGDMRTAIWGMERQDMVGELARAVDKARYQFAQMPDMTLLSDKGPVRLRFEGDTKSLFEAMIGTLNGDAGQLKTQASALTETIGKQQEVIALLSSRVEAVLHNVEKRGMDGDRQVKEIIQTIARTAENLSHAQEHASGQLNRVTAFLQERAQGLSEITTLAGKQVAHSLQSLTLSERGIKNCADQGAEAIKKLSTSADDLSQRLFGAVNLLQASGKVLAETTETTQSRLNEAIAQFNASLQAMTEKPEGTENSPADIALVLEPHVEKILGAMTAVEDKIAQQSAGGTPGEAVEQILSRLDQISQSLQPMGHTGAATDDDTIKIIGESYAEIHTTLAETNKAIEQLRTAVDTSAQSIKDALEPLQQIRQEEDETIKTIGQSYAEIHKTLAETTKKIDLVYANLETALHDNKTPDIPALLAEQGKVVGVQVRDELQKSSTSLSDLLFPLKQQIETLQLKLAVPPPLENIEANLRQYWQQTAGQIEATRYNLEQVITRHLERIEGQLHQVPTTSGMPNKDAERQLEQQTQILTELVATLSLLDGHMQDLQRKLTNLGRVA